jgi:uncharacterized protein (TIGR02246 family)
MNALLRSAGFVLLLTTSSFAQETAMTDDTIHATIETMTTAFAQGDVDGILSVYEAGGAVVGEPGEIFVGFDQMRPMFETFISYGVNFTYGDHEVIEVGDIALHLMKWTAPSPDGEGAQSALSVAVLRKQPDGSWKMVIDHPNGDMVMHSSTE